MGWAHGDLSTGMFDQFADGLETCAHARPWPDKDPIHSAEHIKRVLWCRGVGHDETVSAEPLYRPERRTRSSWLDEAESAFALFCKVPVLCADQVVKQWNQRTSQ